ncbi:hypothetical protein KI387_007666, partial [Taxus chinensis]
MEMPSWNRDRIRVDSFTTAAISLTKESVSGAKARGATEGRVTYGAGGGGEGGAPRGGEDG